MSRVRTFGWIVIPLAMGFVAASADAAAPSWPAVTNETRPWVYNWWMGSAVDADGQQVKRAGPGGRGPMMDPFSVAAIEAFLTPFSAVGDRAASR